ncbi:E3 ubiquitin-protein ligase PRT1 [Quillaja saponaria]|uniref:E3 ubiquitin-protein ligase PRT1 n=1 Tax=Quillaja saponaria TaxID=32244 RepID=A0AAD7PNA5_QUISA|nr:E3 ubiquitin-protein ligase PRT1 [Quillaja saponaria]
MEDKTLECDESEEVSESFVCCVCLDLLYKPIVLSCGHISCFWCVHKSMSGLRESHCPLCRNPYYHFPTVCQMLHFLLLKMYPVAYKSRENQVLEEEKRSGLFSPQFHTDACGSQAKVENQESSSCCTTMDLEYNSLREPFPTTKEEPPAHMEQLKSVMQCQQEGAIIFEHASERKHGVMGIPSVEEENFRGNEHNGQGKEISVANLLCTACKQLLFRPVVLNCGHVFCDGCIMKRADEMLRCQVCQSPYLRGFPKVCLELDNFLKDQFPEEYALRRDAVQLKTIKVKHEIPSTCSRDNGKQGEKLAWWSEHRSKIHINVGCDFCGMYPIIGDRYRCKDCVEKIGFDLCGDCYNTCSKLPGRFNQQHTPEHKFELVRSNIIRNIMLRLVTGHLDTTMSDEPSENSEVISLDSTLSDDGEENQNDSESSN